MRCKQKNRRGGETTCTRCDGRRVLYTGRTRAGCYSSRTQSSACVLQYELIATNKRLCSTAISSALYHSVSTIFITISRPNALRDLRVQHCTFGAFSMVQRGGDN